MQWEMDGSWALFLDRDGVINERIVDDYVRNTDEFKLLPGVTEALRIAGDLFKTIVVVTNQQGIGRGLMTERNLSEVHDYCLQLIAEGGGRIDRFYFAPNLWQENSALRKPNTGMALLAQHDFPWIDFSHAVMIGDSDSDIQFGLQLGMKTIYISQTEMHTEADHTVSSLLDAIKWIKT